MSVIGYKIKFVPVIIWYVIVLEIGWQQPGDNLNHYLQTLKTVIQGCDFKVLTVRQAQGKFIRDAFINRILSHEIRQRLLENKTLDLATAYDHAYLIRYGPETICIWYATWNCWKYTSTHLFLSRDSMFVIFHLPNVHRLSLFKISCFWPQPILKTLPLFIQFHKFN